MSITNKHFQIIEDRQQAAKSAHKLSIMKKQSISQNVDYSKDFSQVRDPDDTMYSARSKKYTEAGA